MVCHGRVAAGATKERRRDADRMPDAADGRIPRATKPSRRNGGGRRPPWRPGGSCASWREVGGGLTMALAAHRPTARAPPPHAAAAAAARPSPALLRRQVPRTLHRFVAGAAGSFLRAVHELAWFFNARFTHRHQSQAPAPRTTTAAHHRGQSPVSRFKIMRGFRWVAPRSGGHFFHHSAI